MLRLGKTLEEANLVIAEDRVQLRLRTEIEEGKCKANDALAEVRLTKANAERMQHEALRRAAAKVIRTQATL